MNDIELAWAAGLFEGEGSISISKPTHRNWGHLMADVPNTDDQIVRFFVERWGGVVQHHPSRGRRRAYWRWRTASRQAAAFLRDIRPFVITDRVKGRIDHGVAFQEQKRPTCSTEDYREAQWAAYWWMAELNLRGVQ